MRKSRNVINLSSRIPSSYQKKTSYITISNNLSIQSKEKEAKFFPTALPLALKSSHRTVDSFLFQAIPKFGTLTARQKPDKVTLLPKRASNISKTPNPISILSYNSRSTNRKSLVIPEYNILTRISQDFTAEDQKRSNTKRQSQWQIRLLSTLPNKSSPFYSTHSNLTTSRTNKTKRRLMLNGPQAMPYLTERQRRKQEAESLAMIELQRIDYNKKVEAYLNAEFLPIQDEMSKHNNGQIKSLHHELEFKANEDFEIVNPKKFSSDYRFNFELISQKKREAAMNQPLIQRIARKYNLTHLLEDYSLRGEVKKKVDVILVDEKAKRKRQLGEKWKKAIIKSAIHFQRLNISLVDFYQMKKLNIKPYEHEKTYLFFQAIKDNDISTVIKMLESNRSLAYDYDHFHQTMLHWMAKRNRSTMIPIAIKKGANINAEDIAGRTPLHLAALMNNIEAVMILLYELASPFICDKDGQRPIDLTSDPTVSFILKRVVLLYYIHTIGKAKLFESNIRRGLAFLYINELRLPFDSIRTNY